MTCAMNRYNVLSVIGTGSFGKCYKVLRKDTGQIFVWKAVDYGQMSEEKKKLLVSEVNLLSGLNHQNIVKYFDRIIHKPTTTIYIVMEWCAGGDLSSLINQCKKAEIKLDEKFVWRVLYQLSQALQLCHFLLPEGPVLHRDIKPANVFLDGNGNVKLGDFGLAYLLQEGQTSVFTSAVIGTPFYMSPEALQNSHYSEKSDIWSLGCLMYELCALQPPFGGFNIQQLIQSVQAARFNRIPSDYSNDLEEIISHMLTVDHRARPNAEAILHHPQVILHIVQESLESVDNKLFFPNDSENSLYKKSKEIDFSPFSLSPRNYIEEVAKFKETLHFKIEQLKEWKDMLDMREFELCKKERALVKREKHIAASECLVKERLIQADRYLRHCYSHQVGNKHTNKFDVSCNPLIDIAVLTDEGETSFTLPTSTKLNPNVVEKPAVFSRTNSEKRVHFGTLPSIKSKCVSSLENDASCLLIDNYNLPRSSSMKQTFLKCEKSGKLISNKSKRKSVLVDSSSKSGSSASNYLGGSHQWDDERRVWLEQKRVQYLSNNKENIPTNNNVSYETSLSYQGRTDGAIKKNNSVIKKLNTKPVKF